MAHVLVVTVFSATWLTCACDSYAMSGVAAWSIITGASFFDVLDSTVTAYPDKLELYMHVAGRK